MGARGMQMDNPYTDGTPPEDQLITQDGHILVVGWVGGGGSAMPLRMLHILYDIGEVAFAEIITGIVFQNILKFRHNLD